jgi:hypothetical protein
MARYDPDRVAQEQVSPRWSAQVRAGVDAEALPTWDADLLREPRVLVPVDVQALVVPAAGPGAGEPAVALPGPLSPDAPAGVGALEGPAPFGPGAVRPPGVHLHWAMPDALLRGRLQDPRPGAEPTAAAGPTTAGGGLGLPALPDRWAVLRLLAAEDGAAGPGGPVSLRGWVLDAARGLAWDLPAFPAGAPLPTRPAAVVPPEGLTGAAGGSLTWTGGYDASFGRFAWHDPLDDLTADPTLGGALPGGPVGGRGVYLVVGWWSDPGLDPLDEVRTEGGLGERLSSLAWRLLPGGPGERERQAPALERAKTVGLPVRTRWSGGPTTAFDQEVAVVGGPAGIFGGTGDARPGRREAVEASTLLHGMVVAVPVDGTADGDLRPPTDATRVALGDCIDELFGSLVATGQGLDGTARASLERLLTAFTSGLLPRVGSPDGLAGLDQARHAAGFTSVHPGEAPETDRVRTARARIPPRTRVTGTAGRGRLDQVVLTFGETRVRGLLLAEPRGDTAARRPSSPRPPAPPAPPQEPGEETVERPAPRRYVPSDPVLAVAGAGRSLRHGGDGRFNDDGRLGVRRGSQVVSGYEGLVEGSALLAGLPSGALPPEALGLAREALLLSPHLARWLGLGSGAGPASLDGGAVQARMAAEFGLRYDDTGAYTAAAGLTPSSGPRFGDAVTGAGGRLRDVVAERVRRHSLLRGTEPDPVAVTAWAQPWVPMWLEWDLTLATSTAPEELAGWVLGAVDAEPADAAGFPATPDTVTVAARVPLTVGPAEAVAGAVARYVADEDERDRKRVGEVDAGTRERLDTLASHAGSFDLVGAVLDGVRQALLGLPVTPVRGRDATGAAIRPTPTGPPRLVAAGAVTLTRARVVDAFGRTLDLSPATAVVPTRLEVPGSAPATMRRPPRLSAPARCQLRLVGADTSTTEGAVPARVDEIDEAGQVNPVAGFLLPDHVDESIEVFSTGGDPLGELLVEPVGGGVVWEPAPGRPLPHDAAPGAGLAPAQAVLGRFASGLVAADSAARRGGTAADAANPASAPPGAQPVRESALAALLRAVDTTLWTVDPIAGEGSSAIGAIVGRPVAVVAATLSLDVADDLDDLELDPAGRAAREAAYRDLVRLSFPVRLGEITRTDDGLLGYFLDGDFTRMRLVDRAVADLALESGRGKGFLGPWAETPQVPAADQITHPYLHAEDEVLLRPGVPRLLTMLMLPGAAVHATSGVVPRSSVRLARAWFAAGLERLSPSVRVGPVLVDPGDVRLPLVAALGERQTLTTREGPLGWRDDAILAATQSAVLPERTSVLREGWIRVTPASGPDQAATGREEQP